VASRADAAKPEGRGLKLFAVYTREHAVLKDEWFLKTLRDPFDLHIRDFGSSGPAQAAFGSAAWLKAIRRRCAYFRDVIAQHQGETVLLCDLDIQFFGRCLPYVERAMEGRDIVFQSESWPFGGDVNLGFVCVRCNPRTLALYDATAATDFEALPIADQTALNRLLAADGGRVGWGTFDNRIWARSQGSVPPYGILLHHANCAGTVAEKVDQLTEMRRVVAARQSSPYQIFRTWRRTRRERRREAMASHAVEQ
jgi:hypothetical protein